MYILGLIGNPGSECHNSSAALFNNDKIVAAAEQERFSRRKYATGEAPYDAIKYCLDSQNITLDDVDHIAISWEHVHGELSEEEIDTIKNKILPNNIFKYTKPISCSYVKHHLTHLTSAFYQSGFNEAACLIIDGQGENESITFAKAFMGNIEIIKTFSISSSLGAFYDAATGYVGLGFAAPGKFMGLAPYGVPDQESILEFDEETGKIVNKVIDITEEDCFYETRSKYIDYFEKNCYPYNRARIDDVSTSELMTYVNFSASIQRTLDNIVLGFAKYLKKVTKCNNLVMSGGVALNCTSNGFLDRAKIFNNIFVYPAANDAGCSVGAALEIARQKGLFDLKVPNRIKNTYLGKKYNDLDYSVFLNNTNFKVECIYDNDDFICRVADLLSDNKILAWFQDGFEFGPRALGARSIISNPCMRENINKINITKSRELWRPLSPVVLDKYYKEVFIDETPENMSEFMLKTCQIKDEWIPRIPAVVHIDKTSRPQYLTKEINEKLYNVIEMFYTKTGIPLIVNTSFNIKNQPIINSPREALLEFERNEGIDGMIMGNWYICR